MSAGRHPTQSQLLKGAIRTLEDVLMPELSSDWARASALGLAGQLRYAITRSEQDSLAVQDLELTERLNALFDAHPDLAEVVVDVETRDDESFDLRARAARLLVHALGRESADAVAIREQLRPLLRAHVGQDLGETGPMLQAFLASGMLGSKS